MTTLRILIRGLVVAACWAVVTTCGDEITSSQPGTPASIVRASGNAQAGTVGELLPNPIVAKVVDSVGREIPGVRVTWSVTEGGGHVSASLLVTDARGQVIVGWTLGPRAGANELTAGVRGVPPMVYTATGIAVPTAGVPATLLFTVQPTDVTAGEDINPAVQVAVLDEDRRVAPSATNPISLEIASGTGLVGAALGGRVSGIPVEGVATFSNLTIDTAGSDYRLVATTVTPAAGLTGTVSTPFAVRTGPAATLGFLVQPSNAWPGVPMEPQVLIEVRDAFGNPVDNAPADISVTVTAGSGTPGAVLSGTMTKTTGSGVASFDDLIIDRGGIDYTLTAASTGLSPAVSTDFVVGVFVQVAAATKHSCGVTGDGKAYCWGFDADGQLGDGTTTQQTTPVAVSGGLDLTELQSGGEHTCGLIAGGDAHCWGYNASGQLGDGTTTDRSTPLHAAVGLSFVQLGAGGSHTCGITSSGDAHCWGRNLRGQLGDGTKTDRSTPVAVVGGFNFSFLAAGGRHTCGLTGTGEAHCWGYNHRGQLGDGTQVSRSTPVPVAGGLTFSRLAAGWSHTCGLTGSGGVHCWGYNGAGQLGDGTSAARSTPVSVVGGLTFSLLVAGDSHTCGVTVDGLSYCWGYNAYGRLGDGTTTFRVTPALVLAEVTFVGLSGGANHTCGLTASGAPYCWGYNYWGQLGDGTGTSRTVPTPLVMF